MNKTVYILIAAAKTLWRDSSRWKWTLIGAIVLTMLSFIGANGPQNTGRYHPQPPIPPINPTSPVDQKAALRLKQFYKVAKTAEAKIQAEGERCERYIDAANYLQEGDRLHAGTPQIEMLDKTDLCRSKIEDSNERWRTVQSAGSLVTKRASFDATQSFIQVVGDLNAFDRSRSISIRQQWLEKAQTLKTSLESYKKELSLLESLASLYRKGDPASVGTANEIITVRKRLDKIDINPRWEEFSSSQKMALDTAKSVERDFAESDRRLSAMEAAWNRRKSDPISVAMIFTSLTPVDKVRWDSIHNESERTTDIESSVEQLLPTVLTKLLAFYHNTPTRALADQIVSTLNFGNRLNVTFSSNSRKETENVVQAINNSEYRLKRLVEIAEKWNKRNTNTQNGALERDVLDAVAAVCVPKTMEILPFDAEAITPAQSRAFAKLLSASIMIQNRLPQDKRSAVSMIVEAPSLTDHIVAPLAKYIRQELVAIGFRISTLPEDAVLKLTVWDPAVSSKGTDRITGERLYSVSLIAKLDWIYSRRSIDLGNFSETSHAREAKEAIQIAEKKLASKIAEAVLTKIGQ